MSEFRENVEDFITERIAAGDPAFARDAEHRLWQRWNDLQDLLWPYVCLTCFLRRLYGIETRKEIEELDATPEMRAAHRAACSAAAAAWWSER